MIQKLKDNFVVLGLIFCCACGVAAMALSFPAFEMPEVMPFLFDIGVDAMGALIGAALFFGCMRQNGEGTKVFKLLIILITGSLLLNEVSQYVMAFPGTGRLYFFMALASKLIDLVLIYLFYVYVRQTLRFEGKLAQWAEKLFPILAILEAVLEVANIVVPTTFFIDASGEYAPTAFIWAEDIFLIVATIITTVLIVKSEVPSTQKKGALAFVYIPVFSYYVFIDATYGAGSQYGTAMMSLIVVYCLVFNEQSASLAATQTELNMATEIQASMLPSIFPAFPERDEFDLYASMDPAKAVGGDFYDFFMIDDDRLACVIADVSGKGVPAALFMMISKTIVQNYAQLGLGAGEALTKANAALCAQNKMEMFVTVWLGILELSTGKMTCSSAGHEYPAICHDGTFELFKDKHGLVLGGMDFARYRDYELQLGVGDKIFVYTDGVPEATNENNELFGTDRMVEALNIDAGASPKGLLKNVRRSVDAFVGPAEQFDDLTMLCIEYRGAKSK